VEQVLGRDSPQIRVEPLMRPPLTMLKRLFERKKNVTHHEQTEIVSVAISGNPNRKASIFIFTTGL